MNSSETTTSVSRIPDPPADSPDVCVYYAGRWMSFDTFVQVRLENLFPPRPKREWKRGGNGR